jgi:hypothetical protein
MDFSSPSIGELAWSNARDANDKLKKMELKLRDMHDRLNGLSAIQTAIENRLDKIEEAIKHHA